LGGEALRENKEAEQKLIRYTTTPGGLVQPRGDWEKNNSREKKHPFLPVGLEERLNKTPDAANGGLVIRRSYSIAEEETKDRMGRLSGEVQGGEGGSGTEKETRRLFSPIVEISGEG